jgi:hypothetical protein
MSSCAFVCSSQYWWCWFYVNPQYDILDETQFLLKNWTDKINFNFFLPLLKNVWHFNFSNPSHNMKEFDDNDES